MASPLTTLVGENLGEGYYKWSDSVYCNGNHHVYGIPLTANRDLKFNPTDKSSAPIEPDLGDRYKYDGGTEDEKGCIYCTPHDCWNTRGMLKIETNTDNVTILDARPPEEEEGQHNTGTGRYFKWTKGALGLDGNIYFMPMDFASRILKLIPTPILLKVLETNWEKDSIVVGIAGQSVASTGAFMEFLICPITL